MKIVFKTLIFAIIAIFFLIGYLSFIGFETDKFNTQISQKIKKIDNLKLNLRPSEIAPDIYYKITEIYEKG